ncbi:hypothetical protein FRC03_005444 [Tulasnella sp. 419]|nr:hypothetical protein FRC03_005444 [Tulasnella sp. 419]
MHHFSQYDWMIRMGCGPSRCCGADGPFQSVDNVKRPYRVDSQPTVMRPMSPPPWVKRTYNTVDSSTLVVRPPAEPYKDDQPSPLSNHSPLSEK